MPIYSPLMTIPPNPNFVEDIRKSFDKQNAMALIKAQLGLIEPGCVEIKIPHWPGIEQQHGFVHGGVIGMIADSAAGYAAMTMVPEHASVLTVEYKLNLVSPANASVMLARGSVVRAGKTLIITKAEVFSCKGDEEILCALMQQTIMVMHNRVEK